MEYSLHIETSSTVCSVALGLNNETKDFVEINNGFSHAENLHVFIDKLLQKNKIAPNTLSFIGLSSGPGSYTGLRIGASAAKGLAFALNIPIIEINTLQLLTQTIPKKANTYYCPLVDARRMEVYTAVFDFETSSVLETTALIIDEESAKRFESYTPITFFGDGMPKCKEILSKILNVDFVENIAVSASYMPALAYQKYKNKEYLDTANFEPRYLKEFYTPAK